MISSSLLDQRENMKIHNLHSKFFSTDFKYCDLQKEDARKLNKIKRTQYNEHGEEPSKWLKNKIYCL